MGTEKRLVGSAVGSYKVIWEMWQNELHHINQYQIILVPISISVGITNYCFLFYGKYLACEFFTLATVIFVFPHPQRITSPTVTGAFFLEKKKKKKTPDNNTNIN